MSRTQSTIRATAFAAVSLLASVAVHAAASTVDVLTFGDASSECSHRLAADRSDIITGGLGARARRLLPTMPVTWEGGRASFHMKVDSDRPNYFTIRLWGSEANQNRLILFCEGKQVGYRHLGDVEILDVGADEPTWAGRFAYLTHPLPPELTRGKRELSFEIRATGPIWPYGGPFEKYQKAMDGPGRGMYRVYTHTDGFFVPPADEQQGDAPADVTTRSGPGPEVLDDLKNRVNQQIDKLLASDEPLGQMEMQFLARAYHVAWTEAHRNPRVVRRVVDGLDAIFLAYRANPELAASDPKTPNADWFGLGPSGQVIMLLAEQLVPSIDSPVAGAADRVSRRAAWGEMLVACRDWHRRHRRLYTNQTMINDLYGIYFANRGVAVLESAKTMPEQQARRYLYESVGLEPWRDSDLDITNKDEPSRSWGIGPNYMQISAKGLTRELGYVGRYGEVIDWVCQIHDGTRPSPGAPGDERIKAQLVKIARARGVFRFPALDADGNRAMRLETIVGWRDLHPPGDVTYAQRTTWDGSPLQSPAITLDEHLVGYARQMFDDGQFFQSVRERMKDKSLRVTAGLLETPDQYQLLKSQSARAHKLPMSAGEPDFVFSDEDDGVIAVKHGDEVLYVSLYWRARNAVNFLARVHYMTPHVERVATVRQETTFEPSGLSYTRPDRVDFGFANGGHKYPGGLHSAHAGEKLPIAKIPPGVAFKAGDESVYAGKGSFYTLRYGPYLIGMNCTKDKTFTLEVPASRAKAIDLVTNKPIAAGKPFSVKPQTTVVLHVGNQPK
jgi:hypothetical protein